MKLNKKRSAAILLSALLFLPAIGCGGGSEVVTQLYFTEEAQQAYGEDVKEAAATALHTVVGNALWETKGEEIANVWRQDSNARRLLLRLGDKFEERGIPVKEYTSIMEALCAQEELLVKLLDGNRSGAERFAAVFGELATVIGVGKTALIAYDFSELYCEYKKRDCEKKYNAHPEMNYLVGEIAAWQERMEGLQRMGGENFAGVLRFWLSGLTVFSAQSEQTASGFLSSLYGGEIALYIRTQGQVLQRLTLDKADYAFLISFLGEVFEVNVCAAIVKANKQADYAEHLVGVTQGISKALRGADEEVAALLLEKKIEEGLTALFADFSEEEWAPFEGALAVENDPTSYDKYLKDRGLTTKFEDYCKKEREGLEQRAYLHSPQLAFLVFGR